MKTFNLFISKLLRISLIFCLFFIWARFYIDNLLVSVLLSGGLTVILEIFLSFVSKKNNIKQTLKKEELQKVDGYANYFILNSKETSIKFFAKLLQTKYQVEEKKEYLVFEKDGEKILLFPFFMYEKFSIQNLVSVFNKTQKTLVNKILICTNEVENNVGSFIKNLPLKIFVFDKFDVYEKLMKDFDVFPDECLILKDENKMTFKKFLEFSLNKKKAKGYIFASFILLFSSLFVKVNVYYLIMSSFLLVLSIISFSNKSFNKNNNDKIF